MRANVEKILQMITDKGLKGEVFAAEGTTKKVKFARKNKEDAQMVASKGYGIRVFGDGKIGFAYSNDWSDTGMREAVELALASLKVSEPVGDVILPTERFAKAEDGELRGDLSDVALRIEDGLYAEQRVQMDTTQVVQSVERFVVANTEGGFVDYSEKIAYAVSWVVLKGEKTAGSGFAFSFGRELEDINLGYVVKRTLERAASGLDGSPMHLGSIPVVFDTYELAFIFMYAIGMFDGEAVGRGRSYLAGKLGQQIAEAGFTLVDGPSHPALPFSVLYDHEGVKVAQKRLIDKGVLTGYLYNLKSAAEFGAKPTGNGFRRSWNSQPSTMPAVIWTEIEGKSPVSELEEYFLVTSVKGVHSGFTPVSGNLSVGADGVLVRGEERIPISGVTVSGNFWKMLKSIIAADDAVEFMTMGSGFFGAQRVAFDGLVVSG